MIDEMNLPTGMRQDTVISINELSFRLHTDIGTIRKLVNNGIIPVEKKHRLTRFIDIKRIDKKLLRILKIENPMRRVFLKKYLENKQVNGSFAPIHTD